MLIKKRLAKLSQRGIYIQDNELKETVFRPGALYKYIIQDSAIMIVPATNEDKANTVSHRNNIKPVIDIRSREALNVFQNAKYDALEVEIHDDRVFVRGVSNNATESRISANRVISFSQALIRKNERLKKKMNGSKRKHSFEIVLSYEQLKQVAGENYTQLSLFDSISDFYSNQAISTAIRNLDIPLKVISLFSGAGMLDLAFKDTGFDIVFANDNNKDACNTYRRNIGNHIRYGSINDLDLSVFDSIGADVIIGGVPCQGFSSANRHTNFLDNPNNSLVKQFIKAVKSCETCKIFVIENVPEILTAGNGRFLQEIKDSLKDYHVTSATLNAADMGDPQMRRRAFIIGSKDKPIELPTPIFMESEYRTVSNAFFGLHDRIPNQIDYSNARSDTLKRMAAIPMGGNWKNLPIGLMTERMLKNNAHSSVYKRLDNNKPSITIANPRKTNTTHPFLNRIISVRECARLFSLPDTFVFTGSLNSKQQQVCNGVPLMLGKSIANAVKLALLRSNTVAMA